MIPLWQLALLVGCPVAALWCIRAPKAICLAAFFVSLWVFTARASEQSITLLGRIAATMEEAEQCTFHITEDISIIANDGSICDWLASGNGHAIKVQLTPNDLK